MKRSLTAFLALAASLVIVAAVFAQGSTGTQAPGTWNSSINLQNTGTADANVVLEFHNPDGTVALAYGVIPSIPAGGSRSLYIPAQVPALADGQYSLIVFSDQLILAVANSASTSPSTAGAYMGMRTDEVGTSLYFPGLYKNYFGFYSEIVLQNVGSTDATNVVLHFYNQKTGAHVTDVGPVTVPGTASRVFALQDLAAVPSGNTNGLLSAQVTSDQDLAGVANIWTSAMYGEFSDYNAYLSGDTSVVYAPALYNSYYGFVSSLTVQNLETGMNADIEIIYSNGVTETKTLLPLQAFEYYQPNNPSLPSGNTAGVFSARIESENGAEIVALVNVEDKIKGLLASYNGSSQGTTTVNCPVVLKAYYEWFSAQTVQNVGTVPTDITITYGTGHTRDFLNVPANGTVNIIEKAAAGSVLPDASSVSAVITSSGEPIVAVVQENSDTLYAGTQGDYLLAYTGVSQ